MSTTSTAENRPDSRVSPSSTEHQEELPTGTPSININACSPEIMRKLDDGVDHSTAKITSSEQSHSLETNASPLSCEVTPKTLEFSPGSESELFSPNKKEDDRPKNVSPINLNLTVIIEHTQQSSWNKGVGCQSAIRTNTSPSFKYTKSELHPAFEITSRASAQSKDCIQQRPSQQDLLTDRLAEMEKSQSESSPSNTKSQAPTSSRTNSELSEFRPTGSACRENGEIFISQFSSSGKLPEIMALKKENNIRESGVKEFQGNCAQESGQRGVLGTEDEKAQLEEMNEDELTDLVENQVLFQGIGELRLDNNSQSHRSRKFSEEDFTTRARLLNSRRTSLSSKGSQTRRNLESRLKIINLEDGIQSNDSCSVKGSESAVSNEQFKSKLKMQADKIVKLRRQSTLNSREDSIDSFQMMDFININSQSRVARRESTFSPHRRIESPYNNSSPSSSKTSGSPTLKAKGGQSPVSILNLKNCAQRRVDSPIMKKPRSKFSGEKQRQENDDRYAQYYESRDEGDSNIDNFDLQDFFKDYQPQASMSCKSQEEITQESQRYEETKESEEEETKQLEQVDNTECTKELYEEHMVGMYKALVYLKTIEKPTEQEIQQRKVPLPRLEDKNLKTLVFDLDQTLIHCVDNIELEKPDKILYIDIPGVGVKRAGINIRPLALECLEYAHQHFEVIVFTASHRAYADAVLDYLDPHQQYIDYRLYREHCVQTKHKIYMKDLRVLGNRDLHKVTIIDNHVYSFGFQLDNGIPILPFYTDKDDIELKLLTSYFKKLMKCKDVRSVHRRHFEFSELLQKNIENFVRFYEEDSDEQPEDLSDTQVQEIANHLTGHSDRSLQHNDSSGSSQLNEAHQDQDNFSQNGDAGSGSGIGVAIYETEGHPPEQAYRIGLQRQGTPTNAVHAHAVPNIRGIKRLDTITAFKSPDYLQQNPLEKIKPITPISHGGNKGKSDFSKLMEEYPKVKLTLQQVEDSDDEMEENEGATPQRKKSDISRLEKSFSDNSPDLKTLIGKLITPDGRPVLKKPKSERQPRPKRTHVKEDVIDREEYLKVLQKMQISSNSGNSSELTRTDTLEEMELESSFQVIKEFISKSKGTLFPDSEV